MLDISQTSSTHTCTCAGLISASRICFGAIVPHKDGKIIPCAVFARCVQPAWPQSHNHDIIMGVNGNMLVGAGNKDA
jgi:hypothetical protein